MRDEEFSRDDLLSGILNRCEDIEAVGEEAAEIALDSTLRYVVEWLSDTGYRAKAEILEQLGEL